MIKEYFNFFVWQEWAAFLEIKHTLLTTSRGIGRTVSGGIGAFVWRFRIVCPLLFDIRIASDTNPGTFGICHEN
jgi:hypothetical protein